MDLIETLDSVLAPSPDPVILKSVSVVSRSARLPGVLSAWLDIIAERTGLTTTDIIEYALICAASPNLELDFIDLVRLHKTKGIKQGKKWSGRRMSSLVREDLAAAALYGVSEADARAQWKRSLEGIEGKSKIGRPSSIKLG